MADVDKLLTEREARFIVNLKAGMSNGDAYIAAGYKVKNKSVASAQANRLLKRQKIQDAMQKYQDDLREKSCIKGQELIDNIWPIVSYRTSDYFRLEGGEIVLIEDAINDPIMSKAIKQIRITQYGPEIVFHDKLKAVELVARMTGLDQPKQATEDQSIRVVIAGDAEQWAK